MQTVRTVAALREAVAGLRGHGGGIGLVPTMGALHDGHLGLVRLAHHHARHIVATIFVNPTQFGPGEDLAAYPRGEARDAALLESEGVAVLFAPAVEEMYPPGFATSVRVAGLSEPLCGATRPGHFDGVSQVVTKLLNQAQADIAVFGEKDWQQLAIIRRLARDLDIPTEIVGAPIARAPDGLAMSSRNRYLSTAERATAPALNRALTAAAHAIAGGADAADACADAAGKVIAAGFAHVDYLECREAASLAPITRHDPATPARVFGAAHLGRARLIDNVPVPSPAPEPVPAPA